MSTYSTFKSGLVAVTCLAGLSLSACASNSSSGRYGSVYDYESGGNCGATNACQAAPVVAQPMYQEDSRYGSADTMIGGQPVSPGVVYADCSQISGMNCNAPAQPMYPAAPAPVYSQAPSYNSAPAECPSGTIANPDGTCMMSESSSTSYSTYTAPSQSYSEPAACPAGTTPNGDGTCMEQSSSSYSGTSYTAPTYTAPSQSYSEPAACPAGTTPNGDGTCMESSHGTVEIYQDTTGYQTPSDYTAPTTYLPIRK